MGLPSGTASNMGQLTANPSSVAASAIQTDMRTPAWWLLDMSPIVLGLPDERGDSVLIPHSQGRLPVPSTIDETVYVMPFHVIGDCDASGNVPTGSKFQQLRANRQHLLQNVMGPYNGTTATRVWKLTFPDGTSVLFQAKARLELVKQSAVDVDYVFDLRVPGGYV